MIVYNCVTLVLLSLLPHIHNKLIADGLRSKLASIVLSKTNTSTAIVSLPLRLALCKLTQHAEGEAKSELLSILGFQTEGKATIGLSICGPECTDNSRKL
ncbi:unnamed protein product [Leptidea sinapis]|uniref:Uncharacterized protein n=1 Tax=Leptidea sinapis TaxID=189913 RepID=A0A5E4Q125_9NEOP|nr:unnamed protein product [Leptidea sinapis]